MIWQCVVETCLCMSQLAPVTSSAHWSQLRGICGDEKTCVFLRLVSKNEWSVFRAKCWCVFNVSDQVTNTFIKDYHWWWNVVLSTWSRKQTTNFAIEIADISMTQGSSHVQITNEDIGSSISSISSSVFTSDSFHRAKQSTKLSMWKCWRGCMKLCV